MCWVCFKLVSAQVYQLTIPNNIYVLCKFSCKVCSFLTSKSGFLLLMGSFWFPSKPDCRILLKAGFIRWLDVDLFSWSCFSSQGHPELPQGRWASSQGPSASSAQRGSVLLHRPAAGQPGGHSAADGGEGPTSFPRSAALLQRYQTSVSHTGWHRNTLSVDHNETLMAKDIKTLDPVWIIPRIKR